MGGVKTTNLKHISPGDTIVLVLGRSGSGRSTFISKIVGCDIGTGSNTSLEPKTKYIIPIRLVLAKGPQHNGDLILVDTPSIELGEESKELKMISNWCQRARDLGLGISGVLYFLNFRNVKRYTPAAAASLLYCGSVEHNPEKAAFILSMERQTAAQRETMVKGCKKERAGVETMEFSGNVESAVDIMQRIGTFTPDPSSTRPNDTIIAILGPTGSGKSTFICTIAKDSAKIGHTLESCTNTISLIRVPGARQFERGLVFVDTPGFDDTHLSEFDILKMISTWLKESFGDGVRLSGLLYFHRISDNRMPESAVKNLALFRKLCGNDRLRSVILVTTMWDEVDAKTGENRESELKKNYWGEMISEGSRTARFYRTGASALDIINPLIDTSPYN